MCADHDISSAVALELFDDVQLLARIPFAATLQRSAGGVLRAKVSRTVGLADGEVSSFRVVDAGGGTLYLGPTEHLTMSLRTIKKGEAL